MATPAAFLCSCMGLAKAYVIYVPNSIKCNKIHPAAEMPKARETIAFAGFFVVSLNHQKKWIRVLFRG